LTITCCAPLIFCCQPFGIGRMASEKPHCVGHKEKTRGLAGADLAIPR
jgi:hypothetical protein